MLPNCNVWLGVEVFGKRKACPAVIVPTSHPLGMNRTTCTHVRHSSCSTSGVLRGRLAVVAVCGLTMLLNVPNAWAANSYSRNREGLSARPLPPLAAQQPPASLHQHAVLHGGAPSQPLLPALAREQGTEVLLFARHAAQRTVLHSEGNLLLWAALAAEGHASERDFLPQQRRLRELARKFKADIRSSADLRTQATALHELVHREVLTGGYDLGCSTLTETLQTGRFNCVTATILYVALCHEVGIEARGLEIPAHVYAQVGSGSDAIRVETTCARWFELSARDLAAAERVVPGRPADANSNNTADAAPRALDIWQLTAILYYNQGVDHAERNNYPAAIAANSKAYRLDPLSRSIRKNLLSAINNWALDMADNGNYHQAIALLEEGQQLAPEHTTFNTNIVALYQRWVDELCQAEKFAEADAAVRRAMLHHRDPRLATEQFVVYRRWGSHLVGARNVDQVLHLCATMRQRHPGDARAANAEADLLVAAAWTLLREQRTAEGLRLLDDGSRRFPNNAHLQQERARAYELYRTWQTSAGRGA